MIGGAFRAVNIVRLVVPLHEALQSELGMLC